MAKLTKPQMKAHEQACALLEKDELTFDEKWSVFENWHEGAEHMNGRAGAFFTPVELASDFRIDVCGPRIIDLCAGIGVLAFMAYHHAYGGHGEPKREITCVEINPAYAAMGKKLLPEATWICGDVFEVCRDLGHFDSAIANPPFGRVKAEGRGPRYSGPEFEYKIIDLASQLADFGTFILPQGSAGFRYSGAQFYERQDSAKYRIFAKQTGIHLEAGCGIDTTVHQEAWKGSSVLCEIVTAEFDQGLAENLAAAVMPAAEAGRHEQLSLF